ncbi:DNA (cytosine-5-)-methyltransferase [Malaciobacter marinus]|uniref:DNA (cytosine-5-)-methyltransferase n=1 Tax=Malaciobacter marinus TaxID=505249 RepID=UPI0018C8AC4B|nr:DNA (cytosine-5-)-methyltransferase [Malaciobacter marinus]
MKFIDLFAGIGGFRTGFEKEGFECVFSSEIDEECQEVYYNNYNEKPASDITKIEPISLPDFDVLLGGFPCQPFSISGRKKGFEDTRGTLFFDICRIIEEKTPSVVVLENVKHIIHHDKGNTIKVIKDSLESLDYFVEMKVLNSKDFGLPQNRERIIIVASKNKKFNFDLIEKNISKPLRYFLDKEGDFEYLNEDEYTLIENPKKQSSGLIFVGYRNKNIWKKGIRPNTLHLSRVHRQPNRIYSIDGYHPTIPSQETAGRFFIYLPEENRVRKLTINECYRIMGFDDNFIKSKKNADRYKQIGNSISINLVNEIAKNIIKQGLLENEQISNERCRKTKRIIQSSFEIREERFAI